MSNHTLVLAHTFNVPVEKLYQAWTDDAALREWWKPMDTPLHTVSADLRAGGDVVYEFLDAKFKVTGTYETVRENEELAYSWNWQFAEETVNDEEFKLHIRFKGAGDASTLEVQQDGFKNEEERKAHEAGWQVGFEQLENYLSK